MGKTASESLIYIVILGLLLIEMVYLLISIAWYNYNNPIYLSFWAVCCRKQVKPKLPTLAQSQSKSQSSSNDSNSNIPVPTKPYMSKLDWFIFVGLDTILHSILLPLYLISLLVYMCIRINIESINISIRNGDTSWFEHLSACSYVYPARIFFPIISHYLLLIFISSRALRLEWFRFGATKCNKLYPLIINIWFIFYFIFNIIPYFSFIYKPTDDGMNCILQKRMEPITQTLIGFGFFLNVALCFVAFWRPFCIQKSILKDLTAPNNDNEQNKEDKSNTDILELLNAINKITKRVCILGTVAIIFAVISLSISIYGDIWYFSICYFVIMVNLYFVLCFTFKDWKIKTSSCCVYKLGYTHNVDEKNISQNIESDKSQQSDPDASSTQMQIR